MKEKTETSVAVKEEKALTEFIPFGGKDAIKLSVSIVLNLICVPTKSGAKCSERDAIKFIAMCKARMLNPFEGDAFLIGYDGQDGPTFSLITAHQAFLKRAELNPEYNGMESGVMVVREKQLVDLEGDFHLETDQVIGGWAKVHFKNRQHPMVKRIRLARFNTNRSQWAKDPGGMICKCAEADALRSSFPTMLGGLYLQEEVRPDKDDGEIKAPMFKRDPNKIKPRDEPVEISEARVSEAAAPIAIPQEPAAEQEEAPLDYIRSMLREDKITEKELIKNMIEIGLADEDDTTLDDVDEQSLSQIADRWADISARMKKMK
jgi:phage recombination protein Bet